MSLEIGVSVSELTKGASVLVEELKKLDIDVSAEWTFGIAYALTRAIDWRYRRDKDMKIEIDVSLSELTKAARVLVTELQKLGMGLPISEAVNILGTLLSSFSKSKAEVKDGKEGPE